MKRSLVGSVIRTLFPRAYLSAYPHGRTFGPASGQLRSKPSKLVMNDISVGAYYKFSESENFKYTVLDFSNYLYLESLSLQENFDLHNLPILGAIRDVRLSYYYQKLIKELKQFQDDLDELINQVSTIAKVTYANNEAPDLPVACATNILYLLSLKSELNLKDSQNLDKAYAFCFKLLEDKIDNIHLEGIGQAIWGLARLLERGGQFANLVHGANGQRIIDKLLKKLQGRAFGDEIRYVDKLGMNLDQYVASSEYLSNKKDSGMNFLNENWAGFVLIEGLTELKERRGFEIDGDIIASLKARRSDLNNEAVGRMRASQNYLIPQQISELPISQS